MKYYICFKVFKCFRDAKMLRVVSMVHCDGKGLLRAKLAWGFALPLFSMLAVAVVCSCIMYKQQNQFGMVVQWFLV